MKNILLYDGECGICDSSVQFVLRHDTHEKIYFAPLQSKTGEKLLSEYHLNSQSLDSVVFISDNNESYIEAEAVLKILATIGGVWQLFAFLGKLIPAFLRKKMYRWVARNRHRLQTKKTCSLPNSSQNNRFIDFIET